MPAESLPVASIVPELPFTIDFFSASDLLNIASKKAHSLDFAGKRV